jgi:hypothetical protein
MAQQILPILEAHTGRTEAPTKCVLQIVDTNLW